MRVTVLIIVGLDQELKMIATRERMIERERIPGKVRKKCEGTTVQLPPSQNYLLLDSP